MTGSVYVMRGPRGVKIGRAADPSYRLKSLQTANAEPLDLCFSSDERAEAAMVENIAHQLLAEKRLIGEWFDVTPDEAIAAIREAVAIVDRGIATGKGTHVQLTIKLPPDLIDQADAFIAALPYKPTRTAFIEEAIRQALEKAEQGKKRR